MKKPRITIKTILFDLKLALTTAFCWLIIKVISFIDDYFYPLILICVCIGAGIILSYTVRVIPLEEDKKSVPDPTPVLSFQIVILDGCQYYYRSYHHSDTLTHKGNCTNHAVIQNNK